MKRWTVISSVVSILFVASILTFSLSTEIASAHGDHDNLCTGPHKNDVGCNGGGGDSDGGGKAFLFEVKGLAVDECGGNTTDRLGASFGQVDWNEKILWDPNFIHVHLKLQLKDVDLGTYEVFGNFDPACGTGRVDRPLCEGGDCDVSVTVKQSGKGRTIGVLRICPFQDAGDPVTVWLTVTVNVNGSTKILRSTPVTMLLPPNQVLSECS